MIVKNQLVSVGIPTYNRPKGLRRTLECITKQTHQNLEIIVSDNCSSGTETETVVREFMANDSRIHYFRQPQNVGVFNNFHFVFEQAHGEYFMWAADDDEWTVEYVETCLQGFQKSEKLSIVNTLSEVLGSTSEEVIEIDRGCTTIELPACRRYKKYISSIFKEQAAVGNILYGVIKYSALNKAMPQTNILSWDHVLLAHLALDGEFYTVPEKLMQSRLGGASKSAKIGAKAQLIPGSLSEQHPWWVREIYLQRTIKNSSELSLIEKLDLSIWSYCNYWLNFGLKAFVKDKFSIPYELYQVVRYGEIRQSKRQT